MYYNQNMFIVKPFIIPLGVVRVVDINTLIGTHRCRHLFLVIRLPTINTMH